MTSSLLIMRLLKTALDSDTLSLEELYGLRDLLAQSIQRREQQAAAGQAAASSEGREQFIQDIMDYGQRVHLPVAPEHLRTVGEFLYDSDVLGLSPDQMIAASQQRLSRPANKE